MSKEYRNSIRSRKSIRAAYADLVFEKKDMEKITVKEIVERADISKSTFYCHYNDIDDLIKEIEDELLAAAKEALDQFEASPNPDLYVYLSTAVDVIRKNERDFKMISSGVYPTDFVSKYKTFVIESLNKFPLFKTKHTDPDGRYAEISFFACGFIDLVLGYLQGYAQISLDEVVELGSSFISGYLK